MAMTRESNATRIHTQFCKEEYRGPGSRLEDWLNSNGCGGWRLTFLEPNSMEYVGVFVRNLNPKPKKTQTDPVYGDFFLQTGYEYRIVNGVQERNVLARLCALSESKWWCAAHIERDGLLVVAHTRSIEVTEHDEGRYLRRDE